MNQSRRRDAKRTFGGVRRVVWPVAVGWDVVLDPDAAGELLLEKITFVQELGDKLHLLELRYVSENAEAITYEDQLHLRKQLGGADGFPEHNTVL